MSSRAFLVLIILFSCCPSLSAQIRDWKGADKTVRGQYVGVEGVSVIVRSTQGERRKLSYFLQSEANQQYVREQLRRKNQLDLLPKAGEERTWTQNNGDTFAGRLAGGDENYLFILVGEDIQAVEKEGLSRSDIELAEQTLRQWEQGNVPVPPRTEKPPEPEKADPPENTTEDPPPSPNPAEDKTEPDPKTEPNTDETNAAETNADETSTSPPKTSSEPPAKRTAREESRRKAMASLVSQRPFYVPPSNHVDSFGTVGATNVGAGVNYSSAGGGLNLIQIVAIVLVIAAIGAVAMQYAGQRNAS